MINEKGIMLPFVIRLTDPIPTTETSITPRQRPKAVHTQPAAGILPIQPAALTPRKRANLSGAAAIFHSAITLFLSPEKQNFLIKMT